MARCRPARPPAVAGGVGPNGHALVVEALAVVVDRIFRPQPANQGKGFVEPLRPVVAFDTERLLLARIGHAESECRQRATAGEAVEAGPLLGDEHRVAPGQDLNARAELQLLRTSGRDRKTDEWIGTVAGQAFGQPQRVEAVALERVDEGGESFGVVRQRPRAEPVTDADLHALSSCVDTYPSSDERRRAVLLPARRPSRCRHRSVERARRPVRPCAARRWGFGAGDRAPGGPVVGAGGDGRRSGPVRDRRRRCLGRRRVRPRRSTWRSSGSAGWTCSSTMLVPVRRWRRRTSRPTCSGG